MSEPIPILEFANALAIGGTERQFVNLVRGIDSRRFTPHVGALASSGQLMSELDATHVPISEYPVRHLYGPGAMRQQLRLARYLVRESIQVIHTHGFYANCFALPPAWLARTAVRIASIRDDGSVWTTAQRAVERVACRLADCTVVNADVIRRRLLSEGWKPDAIAVIRNGVDLSRFTKRPGRSSVRDSLGIAANAPVVGVLARLAPSKGIEMFLEAARTIGERFADVRFVVVGDEAVHDDRGIRAGGSYRRALEQRAQELGLGNRVVFTGFRLDVPEILEQFTVSVLPSVSAEGLPNVVLESMAAGVPVVATDSGGTLEAVKNGETGILVPKGDAGALARAVGTLLDDAVLCRRMGEAGRRRVVDEFSLAHMAQTMQALYSSLLEKKARAALSPARATPR
jgi:glycosyltransferase involved in cell wall biosynthesis